MVKQCVLIVRDIIVYDIFLEILREGLNYSNMYGNVARAWLGPKLLVFLTDPYDIEVILNSTEHLEKSHEYSFFKPWFGEGLLISKGEKWRSHRKMIAPTFHINILKSFINVFYENSLAISKRMEKEIGKEFDCHDYMSEATVNILLGEYFIELWNDLFVVYYNIGYIVISETAMGTKRTQDDEQSYEYAMAVMK